MSYSKERESEEQLNAHCRRIQLSLRDNRNIFVKGFICLLRLGESLWYKDSSVSSRDQNHILHTETFFSYKDTSVSEIIALVSRFAITIRDLM